LAPAGLAVGVGLESAGDAAMTRGARRASWKKRGRYCPHLSDCSKYGIISNGKNAKRPTWRQAVADRTDDYLAATSLDRVACRPQ